MSPSVVDGPPKQTAILDSVSVTTGAAPALTISGPVTGVAPTAASLNGARLRLSAPVTVVKERWTATVPLVASRWGGDVLPAPSGHYSLELSSTDSEPVSLAIQTGLPAEALIPGVFRVAFDSAEDTLVVVLSAPLTEQEMGAAAQGRLEAEYRASAPAPERAVYFESFYGQYASCNPLALDRAIAKLLPDIKRYWAVVDASVEVPPGAHAVIEGSEEWWRARGAARVIIINDWLRKRYRKRPHQTVLQTWHGTMLKKIALNRTRLAPRAMVAAVLEGRRWDVLLSQNPYSTRILRSAYRYRGPVWEEGYPRDDSLATANSAAIRARLGIATDTIVVLYAPTWRDDRPDHIDHLNVSEFAQALGDGYVTLIRGHSRTLEPGRDLHGDNVIDVTGYPDVSELFLAADALITDYSSVMFDFSVTGKPIFFYTPDLAHYQKQLRGFYFDLVEIAPGPIVTDSAELVDLVRNRDALAPEYASRYAAWRTRFNPRDDGHAAERVVARLLATGALK